MTSFMHLHIGGADVMVGDILWKLYKKEQKDKRPLVIILEIIIWEELIRFAIKINRGLWKENRKNTFILYPSSQISNNFIESYNAVYSTHMMTEYYNSVFAFDNQAIQNDIDNQTGLDYVDYNLLNNIIAQVISMYTGIRGHKNTQQYDVFKYVSIPFISFPNPIKWIKGKGLNINELQIIQFIENCFLKQIIILILIFNHMKFNQIKLNNFKVN
ncbi:unnamed protein product [Paramecium pentaurelia]|uniref:Uncharacterized protein n=1 Tax=Paramecium pentaurelia TaxID=43138 RepID=A0A8S1WSD7_9CILI|nr:unnamed protein product [Paramecium pentaurelia]